MHDAGVCNKLETSEWMDKDGNVCTEEFAFGCKVTHEMVHPEMCVVGDEVGGNLCMKGDGHIGGELLLTENGMVPQRKASSKNRRFTLIGLTALTGEPVMAVIIVAGKKPKGNIEAGMDIFITPDGSPNDEDYVMKNSGPGRFFPGGPYCKFRNKNVPAFIRWYESGSITSDILKEVFQTLDYFDLFPRTNPNIKPFALLDGHSSRLELPFLKYINSPQDHWVVCIGVPYGTALWQVGDSKEQNGSFNIAFTRAKRDLVAKRESLGLRGELEDTDLMPLINSAWANSFARVSKNKNAIVERGWTPLNRNIMTDVDVRATMTNAQKQNEADPSSAIILPLSQNSQDFNVLENLNVSSVSSETTLTFPTTDAESIVSVRDSLNYSSGTAAFCIDALLSNHDKMQARERIKEENYKGKSIRDTLKEGKRVTSGIVFKAGTTRLGKTVFDVAQDNIQEKINEANNKSKKDKNDYLESKKKAAEIFDRKLTVDKMTIAELKAVCKPIKRKNDGPMPTKKQDLLARFAEWSGRPEPEFLLLDEEIPTFKKSEGCDDDSSDDDNNNYNFDNTGTRSKNL